MPAALVFLELFIGFGVYYPRLGERRLTFDYKREIADFPHLDFLVSSEALGRMAVISPAGEVLAPSYATMPRGLARLNLHETIFAPDWLERAVDGAISAPDAASLDALGVEWLVSTDDIGGFGAPVRVGWSSVMSHFENSIFWPVRNEPGWLAWDKSVRLYRVSFGTSIVRAEPPSRSSVIAGRSIVPIDELVGWPPSMFADWLAAPVVGVTPSTIAISAPPEAPVRYFAAVTDYPGWQVTAGGVRAPHARAAEAFMAFDVPAGTTDIELRFRPTHFTFAIVLAFAATVVAAAAAGGTTRRPAPRAPVTRPSPAPRPATGETPGAPPDNAR